MHPVRPIPTVEDAPEALLSGGHLWFQELVDGEPLRFQMEASGLLRFGDATRVFSPNDVPLEYRHAVRHVRDVLDRDALRDAVGDSETVTFYAVATTHRSTAYDWGRLPPVLGVDIWSDDRDGFLAPDAVDGIFSGLGVTPVNTFEREVRAVDFSPEDYVVPASAWYDGAAFGVVIRDKTGHVAKIRRIERTDPGPYEGSAGDLVDETIESITDDVDPGRSVEEQIDRAHEELIRRTAPSLLHRATSISPDDVRREIATRLTRGDTPA